MFTALLVLGLAGAVAGLVLFGALCLAIRREDHSLRLTSQPPTTGTAISRRIAGLSVRRATPPAPHGQPEPRPTFWPTRPHNSDHEGR
jgi:hypothetical protein